MPSTSGFFGDKIKAGTPIAQAAKAKKNKVWVNVGGTGDFFRSAAAAMIDNVLAKPRANQDLAENLIKLHADNYEQQPIQARLLTPAEHLAKLVEAPIARAKFLSELTDALRQVTVDELIRPDDPNDPDDDSKYYRIAFVAEHGGTALEKMRLQDTYIGESAIAAMVAVIKVPVQIQAVEPAKEVFSRLSYKPKKEPVGSPIVMQFLNHDKQYISQVSKPEYFESMKPVSVSPKVSNQAKDPELAEIPAKIARQRLLDKFDQTSKWLKAMVAEGDITKESLIDIHIKGINNSDNLDGHLKHGTQQFFEELERTRKGVKTAVQLPQENHDEQVTDELVDAISRAISVGQIDPALVYEAEEKSSPRYS